MQNSSLDTITITQPDDWHLHLRDGEQMKSVLMHTASQYGRAIIMPNLATPITSVDLASAYRDRILSSLPEENTFNPLMTLYLTDHTTREDIINAKESGIIHAVKLYPSGATTNSQSGVTNLKARYEVLEEIQKQNLPLLIHCEVTDPDVDVFDKESVYLDRILIPLRADFPELKVVFEHITTKHAADYIQNADDFIAATITPHHLKFNRNVIFQNGIQPHFYCLPILKAEEDRLALIKSAISGNKRFFLGTDSAPHARTNKERNHASAGCYNAFHSLELYTEIFAEQNALNMLESFSSLNGPDFYNLPYNATKITITKEAWEIPTEFPFADQTVVPIGAGTSLSWKVLNK